MKSESRKFILILISIIIILSALFINDVIIQKKSDSSLILEELNSNLEKQKNILKHNVDEIFNLIDIPSKDYWPLLERVEQGKKYYLYVYKHDSLLYWNNSKVYFDLSSIKNQTFLEKKAKSWYLGVYGQLGDYRILLLKPIITSYYVDNQYVKKVVNKEFSSCKNIQISKVFDHKASKIDFEGQNNYYLSIENAQELKNPTTVGFFLICLLYIFIGLLITYLVHYELFKFENLLLSLIVSLGFLIVFRFIDFQLGFSIKYFPKYLLQQYGSSSYQLTLGDVFIDLSLFLIYSVSTYKSVLLGNTETQSKRNTAVLHSSATISFIIINIVIWITIFVLNTIDLNDIYFLIENLTGLIIAFWISIIGLIIYAGMRLIGLSLIQSKSTLYYALTITIINAILAFILFGNNYIIIILSCLLIIFSFFIESVSRKLKQFYVLHHLIYIIVIAAGISIIINQQIEYNKQVNQETLSNFLSNNGDKNIELFWGDFSHKTNSDITINQFAYSDNTISNDSILDYIESNYFTDRDYGFNYQITYCTNYDSLQIGENPEIVNCSDFFANLKSKALIKSSNDLYLIDNEPDNIYYLGNIKLNDSSYLYVEMYSYFIPGGLAYAELLIDKKPNTPDLATYSFAKYHNETLTNKFGDFEYHTTLNVLNNYPDSSNFELKNFIHYKIHFGNNDLLVVSRPIGKISTKIFSFSYFFIALSLLVLLITSIVYQNNFNQLFNLNLRARLQMFFMIALGTITISTAIIILYYTGKNNTEKLHAELNEKAHSVLIELQHKLSGYNSLDEVDKDEITQLLQKFSLVFFSDINLYDTKGTLKATSRPQIFEEGFLSGLVNPKAYEEIMVDNLLFYNCTEKIGNLEYYSTYLPLLISRNKTLGIINLPFFARQTEIKKSFRFLLFTFINLFVILGILGTIVAVFYSRLLTKPLSVLQQNISNIRIDMQNAKIQWDKDDEIGQLIKEYNKMVDKLEASSDLLKRSEREIAWREMARQIAHEIKNPLTPMKLNIQYLIKSKEEKDPMFESKFKDISSNLIEQIETLDRVAEMFSDMSKSNTQNHSNINLNSIINSTVELYNLTDNVEFKISNPAEDEELFTRGTKKGLSQIFSNLVKNSVEAVSNQPIGKININISSAESYITVEVEDNGKGISPDIGSMIFTPYFTTRSTGTGLGLAIVKTILTTMGGDIKLEKSNEKGTIFKLKFIKTKSTTNE